MFIFLPHKTLEASSAGQAALSHKVCRDPGSCLLSFPYFLGCDLCSCDQDGSQGSSNCIWVPGTRMEKRRRRGQEGAPNDSFRAAAWPPPSPPICHILVTRSYLPAEAIGKWVRSELLRALLDLPWLRKKRQTVFPASVPGEVVVLNSQGSGGWYLLRPDWVGPEAGPLGRWCHSSSAFWFWKLWLDAASWGPGSRRPPSPVAALHSSRHG